MAMNNWGGVKEHMTKTPRKVFRNKKKWKPNKLKINKEIPINLNHVKIAKAKRKRLVKDFLWYGIPFIITFFLILKYI